MEAGESLGAEKRIRGSVQNGNCFAARAAAPIQQIERQLVGVAVG
jgi:hypothetical protein